MPQFDIGIENRVPKYLQVANAVTDAIRTGKFTKGQKILSINELSEQYFVSRVTVEKAYTLLRENGTIIPIRGKGFYINNVDIKGHLNILLLFNKISNYKKQIYQGFIDRLGANATVDLKIHHFDVEILRSQVLDHLNDYHYFVIMPHFYENWEGAIDIIKQIPPEKLLILDKQIPNSKIKCAVVYQDFENDIISALDQGLDLLEKYSNFYLVHSTHIPYPKEMVMGFRKFCMQNSFKNQVIGEIHCSSDVRKGDVYIVTEETDLVNLIKVCTVKGLRVGADVGIISYNETPIKEVLLGGITVISTDHDQMGKTAAELILQNSIETVRNPFVLIRRNSL